MTHVGAQLRNGLLLLALVVSCPTCSAEVQHPYDSHGVACIDYPDVGYRIFPHASETRSWPRCTLSCKVVNATAGAAQAPLDQALPAGPCDDDGATCSSPLMAGWTPPCKNSGGPGNVYVCTCRAHKWHCALSSQGGNVGDLPKCLGTTCYATWTEKDICTCGTCRSLCTSDTDCTSGKCRKDELCFPTSPSGSSCPGPDECSTKCTGFCE